MQVQMRAKFKAVISWDGVACYQYRRFAKHGKALKESTVKASHLKSKAEVLAAKSKGHIAQPRRALGFVVA